MNEFKQAVKRMLNKDEAGKNEMDKIKYMIKTSWGSSIKRMVDRKKALQMFDHDNNVLKLADQKGLDKVPTIALLQELESPEVMRDIICFMYSKNNGEV